MQIEGVNYNHELNEREFKKILDSHWGNRRLMVYWVIDDVCYILLPMPKVRSNHKDLLWGKPHNYFVKSDRILW